MMLLSLLITWKKCFVNQHTALAPCNIWNRMQSYMILLQAIHISDQHRSLTRSMQGTLPCIDWMHRITVSRKLAFILHEMCTGDMLVSFKRIPFNGSWYHGNCLLLGYTDFFVFFWLQELLQLISQSWLAVHYPGVPAWPAWVGYFVLIADMLLPLGVCY